MLRPSCIDLDEIVHAVVASQATGNRMYCYTVLHVHGTHTPHVLVYALSRESTRHAHLVGQEVGDPYGAAETVRDATFVDESQPCARVSQGPLWGQAYSRHAERAVGAR